LNAQQGLEDPFSADYQSLMPGIDTIKLDYEMAVAIQAIEQYYANAELQRAWELSQLRNATREMVDLKDIREKQTIETENLEDEVEMTRSELAASDVGFA